MCPIEFNGTSFLEKWAQDSGLKWVPVEASVAMITVFFLFMNPEITP